MMSRVVAFVLVFVSTGLAACGMPADDDTQTPASTPEITPTPAHGPDIDGDGFGANEECDDYYDKTYPGALELCDGMDNDCDGDIDERDVDEDGYIDERCGGDDCNDTNADINPGIVESCDGKDENCNKEIDEGAFTTFYRDRDKDGYGDPKTSEEDCTAPSGYVTNNLDCSDEDELVHPGSTEECNGIDDDCNGIIDDGLGSTQYYPDVDHDGYGAANTAPITTCDENPPGYVLTHDDCDDKRADAYPGAEEVCNGKDDDCDGFVDQDDPEGVTGFSTFYWDRDRDGYGVDAPTTEGCSAPDHYAARNGDCDDTRAEVNPGAPESCDGLDNDCDDERDETFARALNYLDMDSDGFGAEEVWICDTLDPSELEGIVRARGDCDDEDSSLYPGAVDIDLDNVDQDCGGTEDADPHVGLSETSYDALQAALDQAVDGHTVWVGPGTYLEAEVDFYGNAVTLTSTLGPSATVIDAQSSGSTMTFLSGEDAETKVDGFTLQGGNAEEGGGIYIATSSPTVTNCIISGNEATRGGGLYLYAAHPTLTGLTLSGNRASEDGGGLYLKSSSPTLTEVDVEANQAAGQGGGFSLRSSSPKMNTVSVTDNSAEYGGGMYLASSSRPVLVQCAVSDNSATRGGGLYLDGSNPTFSNVLVSENSAGIDGGGLYLKSSSPGFQNSAIEHNGASGNGGGVYVSSSAPAFANCTVTWNSGDLGGGLYVVSASPTITNCVFVDNTATSEGGGMYLLGETSAPAVANAIFAYNDGYNIYEHPIYSGSPAVSYSLLYNPEGQENHNLSTVGLEVLDTEPAFRRYDKQGLPSDLHLSKTSPAVGAGSPTTADPDGSSPDLGAFGGAHGGDWDLDGDSYPDYFWPGDLEDAPSGINVDHYDEDDRDPEVH